MAKATVNRFSLRFPFQFLGVFWKVATAAVMVALSAAPLQAQTCFSRADALEMLEGYKEMRESIGLASNGGVLEVYTGENGSFTIVITMPGGITCPLASGESWETIPKPAAGNDT